MTTDDGSPPVGGVPSVVADAYDATSIPMCSLSWPAFEFVTANAAYRAFSGRSDLIGRNGRDLFPEFEGQQIFEMLERACRSGRSSVLREWRVQLETGSGVAEDYYLDLIVDPIPGADGTTERLQVIVIDVTEQTSARLRAEAEASAVGQRLTRAMDVVGTLQSALLPDGLPVLRDVDVAASYRPADLETGAGGDWFDALPLDDGRVALVVGDVVGHGVAASAVMGQLRSVLGSALLSGQSPPEALAFTDGFAARVPGARFATAVCAVLDPATGDLCYSTAGHLPPLVIDAAGEAGYLEPTGAGPLVTGADHTASHHRLEPGDCVVLFSDGLVERPGRPPAEAMVEVLQVASDAVRGRGPMTGAASSTAVRVATWCVELLTRATGTTDDVTLLAAQLRATPVPGLRVDVAALPDAVRTVRHDLGEWCDELGLDVATRLVLQHGVHELVANSVEHAFGEHGTDNRAGGRDAGRLGLTGTVSRTGVVDLVVADDGCWRDPVSVPGADPPRGRGLALVHRLLDDVSVHGDRTGTVVRASYRLSRPAHLDVTPGPALTGVGAEFRVQSDGEGTVVVTGATDVMSGEQLRDVLLRATRGGATSVVVDLSGVTLLGSTAIAVLLEPWMGGSRLYAPAGSTAQHVLELVGAPYVVTPG